MDTLMRLQGFNEELTTLLEKYEKARMGDDIITIKILKKEIEAVGIIIGIFAGKLE